MRYVVAHLEMRRYNKGMNALKVKRKELGLTQVQAANACGVSRRTYQTYEEANINNATFDELLRQLNELGSLDGNNQILSIKNIKIVCRKLFKEKYPEVMCAYLFGSYARGQATRESDIDILVVCPPMGMRFYGIAGELENILNKTIDLHSHRQLQKNEHMLEQILEDGIKIYG